MDGLWEQLPVTARARLEAVGVGPSRIESLENIYGDVTDLSILVAQLTDEGDGSHEDPDHWDLFMVLMRIKTEAERLAMGSKRRRVLGSAITRSGGSLLQDQHLTASSRSSTLAIQAIDPRSATTWHTLRSRLFSECDGAEDPSKARAAVEEKERLRWAKEMANFLILIGAPIAARVDADALVNVTGSRRARAIRSRLHMARRISAFVMSSQGRRWPTTLEDVTDYVGARAAEPCGRTVPWEIWKALAVVDSMGEFNPAISRDSFLRSYVDSSTLALSTEGVLRKQAPDFVVMLVISLELLVLDPNADLYSRFFAGVKLLMVAASLRWHDTSGLVSSSWVVLENGLKAELQRTKTTGPGRKVQCLPIFVHDDLTFSGCAWLRVWFALASHTPFNFERDYLVMLPTADGGGVIHRPARYEDVIGLTHQLMSKLRSPVWSDVWCCFEGSDEFLLHPALVGYWTEHSPRGFLAGKAAELGIPSDQRDYLGRWLPKQSDAYVRSAKAAVFAVQKSTMALFRETPAAIDESEAFKKISDVMLKWGHDSADVEAQIARLRLPQSFRERAGPSCVEVQPERTFEDDYYLAAVDEEPRSIPLFALSEESDSSADPTCADVPTIGLLEVLPPMSDDDATPEIPEVEGVRANFILSYTTRRRRVTAHKVVQGCYRRPRVELKDFEFVTTITQGEGLHLCRDCWKDAKKPGALTTTDQGSDEADSSGASADSSSSDEH